MNIFVITANEVTSSIWFSSCQFIQPIKWQFQTLGVVLTWPHHFLHVVRQGTCHCLGGFHLDPIRLHQCCILHKYLLGCVFENPSSWCLMVPYNSSCNLIGGHYDARLIWIKNLMYTSKTLIHITLKHRNTILILSHISWQRSLLLNALKSNLINLISFFISGAF